VKATEQAASTAEHEAVAALVARASIRQVLVTYVDAIGRHDWPAVTACFAPTAVVDYGTPGVSDVAGNLGLLRAGMERLTSVSTLLGMHVDIRVDGDRAKSQMAAFTAHGPPIDSDRQIRMSVVRYEDWWLRTGPADWLITQRVCHHEVKGWCDPA
jgi:hypothetical protein